MSIFYLVLFYCFATSIIFTYGIGLERLFISSKNPSEIFFFILKNSIISIIALSIIWVFNKFIMLPLKISFFLPIIATIVLYALDYSFHKIFPNFEVSHKEEIVFEYAPVFLTIFIAVSFLESLAIIISAQIGMVVLSFILNSIKEKVDEGNSSKEWKEAPLILISMGFLLSAFYFIL